MVVIMIVVSISIMMVPPTVVIMVAISVPITPAPVIPVMIAVIAQPGFALPFPFTLLLTAPSRLAIAPVVPVAVPPRSILVVTSTIPAGELPRIAPELLAHVRMPRQKIAESRMRVEVAGVVDEARIAQQIVCDVRMRV
jgi:hypothetical protein